MLCELFNHGLLHVNNIKFCAVKMPDRPTDVKDMRDIQAFRPIGTHIDSRCALCIHFKISDRFVLFASCYFSNLFLSFRHPYCSVRPTYTYFIFQMSFLHRYFRIIPWSSSLFQSRLKTYLLFKPFTRSGRLLLQPSWCDFARIISPVLIGFYFILFLFHFIFNQSINHLFICSVNTSNNRSFFFLLIFRFGYVH